MLSASIISDFFFGMVGGAPIGIEIEKVPIIKLDSSFSFETIIAACIPAIIAALAIFSSNSNLKKTLKKQDEISKKQIKAEVILKRESELYNDLVDSFARYAAGVMGYIRVVLEFKSDGHKPDSVLTLLCEQEIILLREINIYQAKVQFLLPLDYEDRSYILSKMDEIKNIALRSDINPSSTPKEINERETEIMSMLVDMSNRKKESLMADLLY